MRGVPRVITLITGRQGSGKTLYMVKIAKDYSDRGLKIYSNVHLKHIKYEKIKYEDIINCRYENALVIVDEGHQLLPSRASMSKTSRLIVDKFVSMCRKKRVHLMLSTQMARKIDVRIRAEHDFAIDCEKYAYIDGSFKAVLGDENLPKHVKIVIKCAITEHYSGREIISTFIANDYYKYYDTSQIIDIKLETEK